MRMTELQFRLIKENLRLLTSKPCFYKEKLQDIDIESIKTQEDFEKLPFTWKGDLREAYPLGLQAVPDEEIVRIHSSSGTTGTPIIIPYTQKDVDDWAKMFARCYEMAGITALDRIQITPGYGLWTAGIGFQLGAEHLGAMTIPMGPGNTDKQLRMMQDMKATVLCATSSYALLLAEEIAKRDMTDKVCLKKGVIGSERWGEKMRKRIAAELGVQLYDIYGLTEVYGPGIAMSCDYECGMHYWDDYVYFEIVDPKTGEVLPDGEIGELVITTLRKLKGVEEASSEYQFMLDHMNGKDVCTLFVEINKDVEPKAAAKVIQQEFKAKIGIMTNVKPVAIGDLPRSEKKSTRIFDNRY